MHPNKKYEEVSDIELSPMDKSILSNLILGYTPVTNTTSSVMQRVSTDHLPDGMAVSQCIYLTLCLCCMCLCECTFTCVQGRREARIALRISGAGITAVQRGRLGSRMRGE